jgi:hypothetical protein
VRPGGVIGCGANRVRLLTQEESYWRKPSHPLGNLGEARRDNHRFLRAAINLPANGETTRLAEKQTSAVINISSTMQDTP